MSSFRSFDAFAKPVEGLKNKSATGGLITLIAATTATLLFLSQVALYIPLETRQHFRLAESYTTNILPLAIKDLRKTYRNKREMHIERSKDPNNIQLRIYVTFPYIACKHLELSVDGATGDMRDAVHGTHAVLRRPPTSVEMQKVKNVFQDEPSKAMNIMNSCTFQGSLYIPRVGGSFAITISRAAWAQAHNIMDMFFDARGHKDKINNIHNASHYIHHVEFGDVFPLDVDHPLKEQSAIFHFPMDEMADQFQNSIAEEHSGIGLSSINIKLIHTKYKRFARALRDMYQMSVTQHIVAPTTLARQYQTMLPGMDVVYDFTPFSMHHSETRENIFLLLGSLVSIVGDVFVMVGLVSSCLLSAVNVGKKVD